MANPSGPKHLKAFRNNYLAAFGAAVLILLSSSASAQVFPPPATNYALAPAKRISVDSAFYGPTACGIPTDSTFLFSYGFGQGQILKKFAIYYDSCGHHLYLWDPALKAWHIGDSTSGGGGSGVVTFNTRSGTVTLTLSDVTTALTFVPISRVLGPGQLLIGNGSSIATAFTVTGDLSFSSSGVGSIAAHAVVNSKLAQMANATIKGRITAGTGDAEDLTASQVATIVNGSIAIAESQVANLVTDLAAKQATLTGPGYVKQVAGSPTYITTIPLTDQATNTANGLQGWDGSGNPARVIIDAPLQLIGNHLKDTSTSTGGGGGMIPLTNAHVYVGNASNVATDVAVSGDVTITNTGATAIGTNKVANTQAAQMPANTTKGNNTGSLANAADLTAPQEVANLGAATAGQRVMTDPTTGALATQAEVLHQPVKWATAAALPANTYSNGTSGVGATLTATSNGALSIDGNAVTAADRVLIKDEVAQSHNGLYTVTQAGSGGTPYILTRGAYSSIAGNMAAGSHVYVQGGTANATQTFYQVTPGAITFGTSPLAYNVTPLPFTTKGDLLVGTALGLYNNLHAGSAGSVLTPDVFQPTGLRWAIQPAIYLVTDPSFAGGAKGDGQLATDAAMLVGTNIVVSNQATFVPADTIGVGAGTGKVILIKGVGASGNDTLTRITGYTDAHHITVAVNASTGGGGHIIKWGHDDTPAFQAANNAIFANGGGNLIVPVLGKGFFYPIAGPLVHSDNTGHDPNCQIYFPSENFPEVSFPDSIPVVMKWTGDVAPTTEFGALSNDSSQLYTGGCMLQSLLTANYGQGAVIGSAYGTNTGFGLFSATTVIIENIFCEVPDGLRGAYRSAYDLFRVQGEQYKNCVAKTDVPALQSHDPAFPVFGFRGTAVGGGAEIFFDGFNEAAGFKFGFVISEHASGQLISAKYCKFGVLFTASNHMSHIHTIKSHWNANDIFSDTLGTTAGIAKFTVEQLDIEAINPTGRWYYHNRGINDSLGNMQGTLGYIFTLGSLTTSPIPTFNPSTTNLIVSQYGDQLNSSMLVAGGVGRKNFGTPGWLHASNNASLLLYTGTNVSGNSGWSQFVLGNSQSSTNSLLGDLIFGNMAAGTYNASITGYTGAATGDGKMVFTATKSGSNNVSYTIDGATNTFALPVVFPAATASIPSMNIPLSSGAPPSTQGNVYATLNHLFYYDNGSFKDILAGGGGGGGTAAGSAGDVQFTNANGGFSTLPSSLFHMDSTNGRLGIGTASPSFTLHVKGSTASTTGLLIETSNTSTTGAVVINLKNSTSAQLQFGTLSSGYTTSGLFTANSSYMYQATAPLNFMTNAQAINFSINAGTGAVLGISTSGNTLVGGGSNVASALLSMNSTTKGFLPPSMTTTQRNAISSPAEGLIVHDNVLHAPYYYDGSAWQAMSAGGSAAPFSDATAIMKNSSDATKLLKLDLSGLTTATTRTWIFPDVNGTVARKDAAQTFTGVQTFSSSPVVPTPSVGDNSTQVATTAYVDGLVSSANFTSTWTNTTNISSSTFSVASYLKVGNIVFVTLNGTMTHTTSSINTVLTFTLPLTTSTTSQSYCGSATFEANSGLVYDSGLVSVVSGTTGQVQITPSSTGGGPINIRLQYKLN